MKASKTPKTAPAKIKDLAVKKVVKGGVPNTNIMKTKHDTVKNTISNIH